MLPRLAARPASINRSLRRCLSTRASAVLSRLSLPTTTSSSAPLPGIYSTSGWTHGTGQVLTPTDPATAQALPQVTSASPAEVATVLDSCREAYEQWRHVPAPKRGEVLRQIGEGLRTHREDLGSLVSLEMGKILPEGVGEVQEAVDICDYGVGLSRMVGGKVLPSERPEHFIKETSQPLGVVGVVSAFNFPLAVHSWNLSLAFITGNATVWKPAPSTPLTAIAVTKIIASVLEANKLPGSLAALICGGTPTAEALIESPKVDLLSFTGSEHVGRSVGATVQSRFGKVLLELGGNNAAVVMPSADIDLALRTIVFGAVGTAGQRCTSTRRLVLHRDVADQVLERLKTAYGQLDGKYGHALDAGTLIGPLHSPAAVDTYAATIRECEAAGAKILVGGKRKTMQSDDLANGNWVEPTVVWWGDALGKGKCPDVVKQERFCPILHVGVVDSLEEAVGVVNGVDQALSSSLFTRDMGDVFKWTGPSGSRCGIVNVNAGTSGAEIGAGFGGNFSTGWGRESGGDAWKQYCRWSSCTINYGNDMPLAQGIRFE